MEKQKIFKTEFVNKKTRESVRIFFEATENITKILLPKSKWTIETTDPKAMYARFAKVQYLAEGGVKVVRRKNWKEPKWEGLSCMFLNKDGGQTQTLIIGMSRSIILPLGIPVVIENIPIDSPFAKFSEYIIEFTTFQKPSQVGLYFRTVSELRHRGIPRDEKVQKELEKEVIESRGKKVMGERLETAEEYDARIKKPKVICTVSSEFDKE